MIRTRYPQEGPRGLAKEMGRNPNSVAWRAREMGVYCAEGVRGRHISEGRRREKYGTPEDEARRARTAAALRRTKVGAKTRTAERREEAAPAPRHRQRNIKTRTGHRRPDPGRLAALPPTGCMPNALEFMAWNIEGGER